MRRGISRKSFTRERAKLRDLTIRPETSSSDSLSHDESGSDVEDPAAEDRLAEAGAEQENIGNPVSDESSSDPQTNSEDNEREAPSPINPPSHSSNDSSAGNSVHDMEVGEIEDINQGILTSSESSDESLLVIDSEGEQSVNGDEEEELDDNSEEEDEEDEDDNNDNGESDDDQAENNVNEGSDESEDSDGEAEDIDGNEDLYPGAPLTVAQSLLAVMTLALAFSLSGQCIVEILTLISLHCVHGNNCIKSLWKFKKFFRRLGQGVLIFHYFCVECEIPVPSKNAVCDSCNGASTNSYFIEFPLIRQLQVLFLRPYFHEKLQFRFNRERREGFIQDIYDGTLYQQHFVNGGMLSNRNNISFMWYSDGVAVFKSTNFSIWPMYLIINELPYKERMKRENMILLGLYFGTKKPCENLFLRPFQQTFDRLKNEGVDLSVYGHQNPVRVRGLLLCGTCDTPAKSLFLRFKEHNGYWGCPKCKSPGGRYPVGASSVHVHPFDVNVPLRTNDEVPIYARAAMERGQSVYGIKGLSLLYFLMPNMVVGFGIDIMHQCFLGVSKLLLKLWFDTSLSDQPFSMSGMVKLVDARLKKLHPPSFVQRVPRSIKKHLKYWKAQEHKLWLLYYSVPCLSGLMADEYFDHHLKLVSGIYLLSMESISLEQVTAAANLLAEYVRDFARLYGLRFMVMNVHLLVHLAQCVRELGPVWVFSNFSMEDLNGKLTRLIHGTRYAALQVCSGASALLHLPMMVKDLPANSNIRVFCEKLLKPSRRLLKVAEHIDPKTKVLGTYKVLPDDSKNTVQVAMRLVGGHFQQFFRLQSKGVVFCSRSYTRQNLKLSCFVSCSVNGQHLLCEVTNFARWSACHCRRRCLCPNERKFVCIGREYRRDVWRALEVPGVRLSYMSKVTRTENVHVFETSRIVSLCFYLRVEGNEYIAEPINSLEVE